MKHSQAVGFKPVCRNCWITASTNYSAWFATSIGLVAYRAQFRKILHGRPATEFYHLLDTDPVTEATTTFTADAYSEAFGFTKHSLLG
jgi:hypothetical protein